MNEKIATFFQLAQKTLKQLDLSFLNYRDLIKEKYSEEKGNKLLLLLQFERIKTIQKIQQLEKRELKKLMDEHVSSKQKRRTLVDNFLGNISGPINNMTILLSLPTDQFEKYCKVFMEQVETLSQTSTDESNQNGLKMLEIFSKAQKRFGQVVERFEKKFTTILKEITPEKK